MARLCSLFISSLLLATLLSAAEHSSAPPILLLPLTHTLSKTHIPNSSTNPNHHLHLLKSASLRSSARFRSHQTRHHRRPHSQVSLPLSPGSDYTLSLTVGRPHHSPSVVDLYMDTGSDLVWLPCSPFECILCEGKPPSAPANLSSSSSLVSCSSPSCSAAHSSLPSSDLCAVAGCPLETIETSDCSAFPCPRFYYAYGDGSLVARLRTDHAAIPARSPAPLRLQNFTFGCAHTTLAEPVGVAGFGRGVLSLPAQLSELSPHLGKRFSYCLVSHSFEPQRLRRPSPLILGRATMATDGGADDVVYTPMLDNPKRQYCYSVGLEAISVGGTRLPSLPTLRKFDGEGNGGFVVDSGTTFTMLPAEMHARVAAEFGRRMEMAGNRRAVEVEADTGLSPCYHHGVNNRSAAVPRLVLHFAGNATVALPRRNYYVGIAREGRDVGCLMLMSGGYVADDEGGGPAGTLGNLQQQGFEVVYDLELRRVGFARRRCGAMWDALSRG